MTKKICYFISVDNHRFTSKSIKTCFKKLLLYKRHVAAMEDTLQNLVYCLQDREDCVHTGLQEGTIMELLVDKMKQETTTNNKHLIYVVIKDRLNNLIDSLADTEVSDILSELVSLDSTFDFTAESLKR